MTKVCDLLWEHGVYMKDSQPLAREIVDALAATGDSEGPGLDVIEKVIYDLARESLVSRDAAINAGWIVADLPHDAEVRARLSSGDAPVPEGDA